MEMKNTRRGQTQQVENKNCHSRKFLSGISLIRIYNKEKQPLFHKQAGQMEDPRLYPAQKPCGTGSSGMTPLCNTPSSALRAPSPSRGKGKNGTIRQASQGARETAFGFTLIELLVVVLIIAVLAAVALPQYQKAVKKSRGAEALAAAKALHQAFAAYQLETGKNMFEAQTNEISIEPGQLKDFQYCVNTNCHNIWQLDQVISGKSYPVQIGSGLSLQSSKGVKLIIGSGTGAGTILVPQIYCTDQNATENATCEDYFNCQRPQTGSSGIIAKCFL